MRKIKHTRYKDKETDQRSPVSATAFNVNEQATRHSLTLLQRYVGNAALQQIFLKRNDFNSSEYMCSNAESEMHVTPEQVVITNRGTGVTSQAIQVLKEIVSSIGERSATITSGKRTANEQAVVMYNNLVNQGVEKQKKLYGRFGDLVIDVYVTANESVPSKNADEIITEMTDKINELGPGKVSKHCQDNNVIDVAPSSIVNDKMFAASAKCHKKVTKYLGPSSSDPAHHLEIA